METKEINEMLKRNDISDELRASLEKRKEIISKQKDVNK